MRLSRRIATVAAAVVLVGAVGLILRTLDAMGLFTEGQSPVPCQAARMIGNASDTQDMQYDPASNTVFIAAASRRTGASSSQDGLYVYTPGVSRAPARLAGTPADFHPRGISLFRSADGSLALIAINYPERGIPGIDVFDVNSGARVQLHERESVSGDLLVSPTAVVAVDKDRFYVTNEHTSRSSFALALERYLVLPWANVVYFDGASFRVVAKGLTGAGGIGKSSDGSHVYVAETTGREIQSYARDAFSGDLSAAGSLQINSRLANISVAPKGNLFVAGHPSLFKLSRYLGNPHKPSPSEVFRVLVDTHGSPVSAALIYGGINVAAASVAIAARDRLLIGSAFGPKILTCALPQ